MITALLVLCATPLPATVVTDSVRINFRQGKHVLDRDRFGNDEALKRISDSLRVRNSDSILRLLKVEVAGAASPEGSISLNKRLSERRANVIFDYLSQYGELPDSLTTFTFRGRDWEGLIELVERDADVPERDEILAHLRTIVTLRGDDAAEERAYRALQRMHGGAPYRYMYANLFPSLRFSRVNLWYEKVENPIGVQKVKVPFVLPAPEIPPVTPGEPVFDVAPACHCRNFYMALKTNMLYDALLVPNIGAEFYLGRNWSVAGNWMYAWWKTDRRHYYWRLYGGDIMVRKWFGRAADGKPLTGHHIGVYAQVCTYDFETGGKGVMGGVPGGDIWDKANWGVGVEYGYSLPIARRLNIDFGIGFGYFGGEYWEYRPMDGCYVWQATKKRNYFGPTKAEVSLVWLIGCGNFNKGKGGVW